ncbi:bolA-like protein DDB_G0274169 isoform X2 [Ischnura elegans]|uniref:bolA-like protein DDB_G0274169 isoform X2 n=2 Tax=Ischnura elegans TaxID=197161 RepID=UPI001ED89646|nr:bolA-like protein DDB_G0274169 isoform X2 [Ischnura elegans]
MSTDQEKPTESSITVKLSTHLKPEHLEVVNESFMHNVPRGSETHFKVVVVSKDFEGIPLIKRHRIINELLRDELAGGVHALSIIAKSPSQWETGGKAVEPSPACRGGFGK